MSKNPGTKLDFGTIPRWKGCSHMTRAFLMRPGMWTFGPAIPAIEIAQTPMWLWHMAFLEAGETAWISDDVLGEVDMNISGLLETIIALAALFWLVTTACSFLLEAFHAMSNLRGNALRSFVVEMVGFDKTGSGPSIGKQVMDHPLIVAIQTDRRIY
jgi:hypothetical protein